MAHATIHGANGRWHDADFEGVTVAVKVFFAEARRTAGAYRPVNLRTSGQAATVLLTDREFG